MSPADDLGLAHPHNQQAALHSRPRPSGQHVQHQHQHQHQQHQQHQQRQRPMAQRSASEAMPSTADSWIEVSSQASSSSLSSAAGDDIVTTGLRVQQNHPQMQRRRRTLASGTPLRLYMADAAIGETGGSSSQDEYEESGSESDRVLTSSNEGLLGPSSQAHSITSRAPLSATSADDAEDDSNVDDEEDDQDESATALGVRSDQTCFTPQPNAFSHPPASFRESDHYFSSATTARPLARSRHQSFSNRSSRQNHSPLSSSHHADHDAALRASLSTLLSCAAAARGLPKQYSAVPRQASTSNRLEPGSLRMVPESALKGTTSRPRSGSSSSSSEKKNKRQTCSRSSSKERASLANKKLRADAGGDAVVSPTLLTWVVSAGVLVLVSALSFGAGYSVGRESGRIEGALSPTPTVGNDSCGQEALLRGSTAGLRRLRWSEAASAVTAGA